jgi:malonate decarboxylase epsilon subunit
MSVAFVCPAQGSHSPGMLHQLLDHPAVARTLDEISEVLHSDARDLDSEQSLRSDVSVQLALSAAGIATARALMEQDIRPTAVCGLSVGAFGAATAAGVLSLHDAVELVKLRAEQMAQLCPAGYGLSVIVGLVNLRSQKSFRPQVLTRLQYSSEISMRPARLSSLARMLGWIGHSTRPVTRASERRYG